MPGFQNKAGRGGVPRTRGLPVVRSFNDGNVPYMNDVYTLSGISRDSTGVALAGCTCTLFEVVTGIISGDTFVQRDQMVSDANGAYSFGVGSPTSNYRVTFDLAGAPVRAGLTLKTLTGA